VSSDRSEDSLAEDKRRRTKIASSQGRHFGCSLCASWFIQKKPWFQEIQIEHLDNEHLSSQISKPAKGRNYR